eukprot:UN26902
MVATLVATGQSPRPSDHVNFNSVGVKTTISLTSYRIVKHKLSKLINTGNTTDSENNIPKETFLRINP